MLDIWPKDINLFLNLQKHVYPAGLTPRPTCRAFRNNADFLFTELKVVEAIDQLFGGQIASDLVGGDWNMTLFSHSVGNSIIPIDFHIFQTGWNHQPVILLV